MPQYNSMNEAIAAFNRGVDAIVQQAEAVNLAKQIIQGLAARNAQLEGFIKANNLVLPSDQAPGRPAPMNVVPGPGTTTADPTSEAPQA